MTVTDALLQGAQLLESGQVSAARLTAEVLLCHALHCERPYLYAHGSNELPQRAWIHYGRYLNERLRGKPTQYITGIQEFFGREFIVNRSVLIPRPETEHIVEAVLDYCREQPAARIVDVGTGSGAIAISIALESGRKVLATDVSADALATAARNAQKLSAPVSFVAADLVECLRPSSMDVLVSNPPYVPRADSANIQREVRDWEPETALYGGDSGFEIYRRLIAQAERIVVPGGRIFLELGYQSLAGVQEMLAAPWTNIVVTHDLAGWPRVIAATR